MKIKTKKNKKGFSMIEVLLSIFVLSIGIVGAMSLIVSSMQNSMDSRDTIIATNLVQEGLELVRNVRDNNVASGAASNFTGLAGNNCRISYDSAIACSQSVFALNYLNGFYTYAGGSATKFQRKIDIDSSVSGQIIVTSTVSWGGSFSPCTVVNKCTFAQSILTAR